MCWTPSDGWQLSAVHGLPSSTLGGVPAPQLPAAHSSTPLQGLPSEHDVPFAAGKCVTPVTGSLASTVHGLPSSSTGGAPVWHWPIASQIAAPLQALPALQLVPAVTGVCTAPSVGLQESVVHGLPSSTTGGTPATQVPSALQVSAPLQALASEQLLPAASFV